MTNHRTADNVTRIDANTIPAPGQGMSQSRKITVGLIQLRCDGPPEANLSEALDQVATAARRGAQVVALPELFCSRYFCQRPDDASAFDLAEPIPGTTSRALGDAAAKHGIVLIGGSLFEKSANGRYYNTSPVFGPAGDLLGTYRKTHIPEDILYHEQHYFAPGDTGVRVFDTPFGKIAVLICYDQWYPEAARLAALAGAELIVYPTAIGDIDETVETNITGNWQQLWRNVQVGHAAANSVFVAALNRVGREDAITFWGGSFIADPSSRVLAEGGVGEQIVLAECDLDRVHVLQKAWRFLANRRPDAYGGLTR
jgi:N-carbamoylputrescine amidase